MPANNAPLEDRPAGTWHRIDAVVMAFEDAWRLGPPPAIDDFLPADGPDNKAVLWELVHVDLERRWKQGEAAGVEDYLRRLPQLRDDLGAVSELIAAEFRLRREREPGLDPVLFLQRFPGHESALLPRLSQFAEESSGGDVGSTQFPAQKATPSEAGSPRSQVPGYAIEGKLGQGGMGIVYKARQLKLNRVVALKMILAGDYAGPAELARFQTEAETLARLQHPNIVQIYEVGECQGLPYFSMEFCLGGSLDDKLDGTRWQPQPAARLVQTLARAVHAAHQVRVVHRDLKPQNVLLTADGQPKVTDFGLAKKLDETGHTPSDAILGTPSYMAPEQAGAKSKEVGPAADVYALGAILYQLLVGRPPFKAATPLDTVLQVLTEEPVSVRRLQLKVPRDLATICHKCLEKDPGKRYASAEALAEDLRRFAAGEPILARPVGRVERSWRWCRRNPALAVSGALAAAALAAVLALVTGFAVHQSYTADRLRGEQRRTQEALREAERRREGEAKARGETQKALNTAEARRKAEAKARQQAELLALQLLTETGLTFCEKGEVSRGLLWLARALEAVPPHRKDLRRVLGANIVAWHRQVRPLKLVIGNPKRNQFLTRAVLSPDGRTILGTYGQEAQIWDAATGKPGPVFRHGRLVLELAFSPDGKTALLGAEDGTVQRVDAASARPLGQPEQVIKSTIRCLAFSPDGKTYAAGGAGGFSSIPRPVARRLGNCPTPEPWAAWLLARTGCSSLPAARTNRPGCGTCRGGSWRSSPWPIRRP
jgi:tRNA A-37 threonylcarbamoyl transferase component Bud32